MIQITNLSKRFGRSSALSNLTLDIPAGDSLALWGANGAGKTTLIRCVLGLLGYEGRITVGGSDIRTHGKHARMLIGYVPQELGLYDDMLVIAAMRYFARLKGVDLRSAEQSLASVGLEGHESKRMRDLSGGMKQRLALAVALLGQPPILVLDEVTASLDVCGQSEFVGLLAGLCGQGRTLLFASHRMAEVATLAKRVAVLEQGRLVTVVPASDVGDGESAASVLHLHMASTCRASAMTYLRAAGFTPSLNGVGVLVPVAPSQKAVPFRLLADAQIRIDDFEFVTSATAQVLAHHAAGGMHEVQS